MRCLRRNKTKFYYALFEGKNPVTTADEFGNTINTGEYAVTYGAPIECEANISPASGATSIEMFGSAEGYDKIIVLDDPDVPINEYSVLWVDRDTTEDYNYVVRRVAKSINSVSIAISRVSVDA